MEEEINYSTLVFKNDRTAPAEKKEEPTIYSEVKTKKPEEDAAPAPTAGEAAAYPHFRVLVLCLGILCILLVVSISAIIYISVEKNKQKANDVKAEIQQLMTEKSILEREMEEQSRVIDNLNWTLGVILKFDTFPVNDFCPDKKCQPCQRGWIPFQDKCYLFYNETAPWKTWQQSRQYCKNTAADLVVIDSLHEQEFISNHSGYYFDKFHGFWLGLQKTNDRDWAWLDGRNDTLGYWMTEVLGDPGPCALVIPEKTPRASWDPANCTMQNKFICEQDGLIRSN